MHHNRSFDNYHTTRFNKSKDESSIRVVRRGSEIGNPNKQEAVEINNLHIDFEGNDKLSTEDAEGLASQIKAQSKLDNLELNLARCKSVAKNGLSRICDTLQTMKNLSKLSLNLMDNPELDDTAINDHGFATSLLHLNNLARFSLNLSKCRNLSNHTFATVINNLCTIKRLVDFEIDLSDTKLNQKGLHDIIVILMEKREFRRLVLKLGNNPGLTDVSFGYEIKRKKYGCFGEKEVHVGLGKLISVQKSLIRLELWIPYSIKLRDEGLKGLGNGISKNRSIRELLVDLTYCDRYAQKSLVAFFESIKENHIHSLELFLGGAGRIKSVAMKTLANLIHHYVNLTKLQIETENCNEIDPESLKMLGAAIGKRKKLLALEIDISKCNEAVDGTSLPTFLQNSSDDVNILQVLNLKLDYLYRLNDKGVAKIGKLINNNLKHLTTIKLSFCESPGITDNGMFGIYDAIKRLKKLKTLELEFRKLARFKDDSLIIFSDAIAKLSGTLETLTFDVSDCHKITDKGICMLARGISHLSKLKQLKLIIRSPEAEITNASIEDLATGLMDINELDSLDMSFENNPKITEKSLENLLITIGTKQSLTNLRLNLRGTAITEKIQPLLITTAKSISSLIKIEVMVTKTKFPKSQLEDFKRTLSKLPHITRVNVL